MSHPPSEQDSSGNNNSGDVFTDEPTDSALCLLNHLTDRDTVFSAFPFLLIVLLCYSSRDRCGFNLLTSNRGEQRAARL